MDGAILVDKPIGWTSFDVVAKIRGVLRKQTGNKKVKVGHTGTLDPLATGLMIVVVGSYCKRAQELSKLDKFYEVTMKLGKTSTTGDEEGDKQLGNTRVPNIKELTSVVESFVGNIMQTPPIYSAIKIDGKRAYDLARAGKEVVMQPRPVEVYSMQLTDYNYPEVKFTAHVGSGTYIRSLVQDTGEKLGVGSYMSDLRRTTVGKYNIDKAIAVESITPDNVLNCLLGL